MLEKEVLNIIKKIKNVKNLKKVDNKVDMLKTGFLDSLEMIHFIMELEKKYEFKYDNFEEKFEIISIENILDFLSEK